MNARLLIACAIAALGCRPDPGTPDYPDPNPFNDTDDENKLPGDTPWDGSARRLSLSVFYEGGSTDAILVDDETVHYYIYEGSFTQQTTNERVEGYVADRLTVSSSAFWGGGIHFDQARDLRGWGTLHAAVRSSDAAMEAFAFGMVGSAGEGRAPIASYGFVADDEWHVVRIPVADIAGQVGLDAVTVGLLLISPTAVPGTSLLIDDLYFTDWEGQ